jgi:hypothetical protein
MMCENELTTTKSAEGSAKCLYQTISLQEPRKLTCATCEDFASHLYHMKQTG